MKQINSYQLKKCKYKRIMYRMGWRAVKISQSIVSVRNIDQILTNISDQTLIHVYEPSNEIIDPFFEIYVLYSLHNGLTLLHKYTSMERWQGFTRVDPNPRDTITFNTTCVVDNSRYPTGLSASY